MKVSDIMIDTHCHIFSEYYDNIDDLIKKIRESSVDKIIINGCDMKSNLEVLELVKKYDCVYGAIGFHPTELEDDMDEGIKWLSEHLNDDKIVAIGEIGLDYHYEGTDKEKQKNYFQKQLSLAKKYQKPVIVHIRDAMEDAYQILAKYNSKGSIHCFSGSLEMAKKFIKIGYSIGIGGVCTYKNAKNIINVIKNIDLEYILLETDSPYLSPEPKRGMINSPENIPIIALKIADIKEISLQKVCQATTDNANRLFDF